MSSFRPDTRRRRWSLVQVCLFSHAAGREGSADKSHWPVWGALMVFWPHWVCPRSRVCALPVYTAQAPSCSIWSMPCVARGSSFRVFHKSVDLVAPAFCAFPGRAAQAARSLMGALSPGAVCLLPSTVPASVSAHTCRCVCLVFSCDPPGGCRPSRISGSLWLETGRLFAVW